MLIHICTTHFKSTMSRITHNRCSHAMRYRLPEGRFAWRMLADVFDRR